MDSDPCKAKKVGEMFGSLSQIPTVVNGQMVSGVNAGSMDLHITMSQLSTYEKRRLSSMKHGQVNYSDGDHSVSLFSAFPQKEKIILRRWTSSGNYVAIIAVQEDTKGEKNYNLQVWNRDMCLHDLNLADYDMHGAVYDDDAFATLEWSSCEKKLLYVAERKKDAVVSYFSKKQEVKEQGKMEEEKTSTGSEFEFREDWGESLMQKHQSVLCIFHLDTQKLVVLNSLTAGVCPAQAVWAPGNEGIVCVGYKSEPYRLGLTYCPIRQSHLYHLDLSSDSCTVLPIGEMKYSARSPIFSPDGSRFIFLRNPIFGPHFQCSQLCQISWPEKQFELILDIANYSDDALKIFRGIYTVRLPQRCWLNDSNTVLLSTMRLSQKVVYSVNVNDKKVHALFGEHLRDSQKNCTLLDVHENAILVLVDGYVCPPSLVVSQFVEGTWNSKGCCLSSTKLPEVLDCSQTIVSQLSPINGGFRYESVLILPVRQSSSLIPLIVFPHGGPHSSSMPGWSATIATYVCQGIAVLFVSFRGSVGFGQDFIESLPGNVGDHDVKDVQHAVEESLTAYDLDPSQCCVIGGSHGGFLAMHMVGQYPDFYRGACCRNPVINMSSMLGATDIPDWVYEESNNGGSGYSLIHLPHLYSTMYEKSPIAHVSDIVVPVMLMIGGSDLRVPPSQAKELYKVMRSSGKKIEMRWYPKDDHSLSTAGTVCDVFMETWKWLEANVLA